MKRHRIAVVTLVTVLGLVGAACSSNDTSGGGGTSGPQAITSWEQLKSGDRVGVQSGTTGEFWAKENLEPKGVSLVGYTKTPDIFNALEADQLVAAVVDLPVAQDIVKTKPDLGVVQQIETGEQYAFAVNKSNTSLKDAIDSAMDALFADGTYAQIFKKYFATQQLPSYASEGGGSGDSGCPQVQTLKSGTLSIGSDIPYPPFEFNQGGTLVGFDVELMDAIAKKICLQPEWVNANFNTIFTALAADKFDTVASAVTAYAPQGSPAYDTTQQRAQIVAFSKPYYDSLQSLTVKTG